MASNREGITVIQLLNFDNDDMREMETLAKTLAAAAHKNVQIELWLSIM